jgi:hypothetical protein
METRFRNILVRVEPATPGRLGEVLDIWAENGEGHVDPRDLEEIISKNWLHLFLVGEEIVATAGLYPSLDGARSELGSHCWSRIYRSLGGATAAIDLRAVLGSLYEPGTLLYSELYDDAVKSARVLMRHGFERLYLVPLSMLEHAFEANPLRPVQHWVLSPWRVAASARRLLCLIDGHAPLPGPLQLRFEFSAAYGFANPALRAALERLARGDVSVIGHHGEAPSSMEQWIAEHFPDGLMTTEDFWASRTRLH